ncbi:MAG: tetratricopeptide repeat protein [Candidatus Omnitrophica bacterium]|jgi:pentatricopeptide repeat protein|nr:tetratricopeptide repeat protein [Candidatus Omnitrophota bacterium]
MFVFLKRKACPFFVFLLFCASAVFASDRGFPEALSHFIMGSYYSNLDKDTQALAEYEKSLKFDPDNSLAHLNSAAIYIKNNQIDKAIVHLEVVSKLQPDSVEANFVCAVLYGLKDDKIKSDKSYERALKNASVLQPDNLKIQEVLASLYARQGRYKEAESLCQEMLKIFPNQPLIYLQLADAYYSQALFEKAEGSLKKAIEIKADFHQALNFLGYMYAQAGKNLDQAEIIIKKALEFEPDNPAYIDSLGWVYFKQKKYEDAKKLLEKAASSLEDPEIYLHLGDLYLVLGDKVNAKENWEKSLKMDPKQQAVKEKIEGLEK